MHIQLHLLGTAMQRLNESAWIRICCVEMCLLSLGRKTVSPFPCVSLIAFSAQLLRFHAAAPPAQHCMMGLKEPVRVTARIAASGREVYVDAIRKNSWQYVAELVGRVLDTPRYVDVVLHYNGCRIGPGERIYQTLPDFEPEVTVEVVLVARGLPRR